MGDSVAFGLTVGKAYKSYLEKFQEDKTLKNKLGFVFNIKDLCDFEEQCLARVAFSLGTVSGVASVISQIMSVNASLKTSLSQLGAVAAAVVREDFVAAYPVAGEAVRRKLAAGVLVSEMTTQSIVETLRGDKKWYQHVFSQKPLRRAREHEKTADFEAEVTDGDIQREVVRILSALESFETHNDLMVYSMFLLALSAKHNVFGDRFQARAYDYFGGGEEGEKKATAFVSDLKQVESTLVRALHGVVKEVDFAHMVFMARCGGRGGGGADGPGGGWHMLGDGGSWWSLLLILLVNLATVAAHLAIAYR